MNQAFITVIAAEAPVQEYIDSSRTIVKCQLTIPATGSRNVDTPVEYRIWKDQDKFLKMVTKGQQLYIAGAKLRHDLDTRSYSLADGNWIVVPNGQFPLLNQIILSGRCIKDIDHSDPRQFRSTDSGYVITNQTLSVTRSKGQSDLFNLTAINKADDRLSFATWMADMTHKGKGLTVGGKIVTNSWKDKDSGDVRYNTVIQVSSMTLAPKPPVNEIKPQTNMNMNSEPKSLWNNPEEPSMPPAQGWGFSTQEETTPAPVDMDAPF